MPENEKPPETVEDLIRALTRSVNSGFQQVGTRIDEVEEHIDGLRTELDTVKDRVAQVETSRARLSGGVRQLASQTSDADLTHQAAIASILTDVNALKSESSIQLAILSRIERVTSSPMVKHIAMMLGAAIIAWLASKGYK